MEREKREEKEEGKARRTLLGEMVDVSLPPPCRACHVTVTIPTLASLRILARLTQVYWSPTAGHGEFLVGVLMSHPENEKLRNTPRPDADRDSGDEL
jgi:hypothetical protein